MASGKSIAGLMLFALTMMTGCVKDPQDIPNGFTGDPVFGFQGTFGGVAIEIMAGEDNWTMLPVPGTMDSFPVYSGLFSEDGCITGCSPALQFDFFQALPFTGNAEDDFLLTVAPGEKLPVSHDVGADSFLVSFSAHPGLFMSGYSYWENQDGPPLTFQADYAQAVGSESAIHVCFESFLYTGCTYSQCFYFQPGKGEPCQAYVEAAWLDTGYVKLTVRPSGTGPFAYSWYHGQTTQSIIVPVQSDMVEILAAVTVTDSLGNYAQLSHLVRVQDGFIDQCYFPIDVITEPLPRSYASVYADRVALRLTDASGHVWESHTTAQPDDAYFSITSVEPYEVSPAGDPAFKVRVAMRILLENELTGETRWFVSEESVIALSYVE